MSHEQKWFSKKEFTLNMFKKGFGKELSFIHEKKVGFFVYKNLPSKLIIKKQKVLYLQHFHNTFKKKFRWQVVSVFNLNSLLKLLS